MWQGEYVAVMDGPTGDGWYQVEYQGCLLYTSDAADERSSVDLGGRRIIKKKKYRGVRWRSIHIQKDTDKSH